MRGRSARSKLGWTAAALLTLALVLVLVDGWLAPVATEALATSREPSAASGAESPGSLPSAVPIERQALAGTFEAPAIPAEPDETSTADPGDEALFVLHGKVRDSDGEPIAGASLELRDRSDEDDDAGDDEADEAPPLASATSDADGRFTIELPDPSAELTLEASAEGHAPATRGPGPFDLDEELDLTLRWLTAVHGRVLDATTGNPLAGASVVHADEEPSTTDAEGRYRIESIVVGNRSSLTTRLTGYVPESTPVLVRERRPAEVDVRLRRGRPLAMTVVDRESGAVLAGAELRRWSEGPVLATTDDSGSFVLHVEDGYSITLHVSAAGYLPLVWQWTVEPQGLPSPRLPLLRAAWVTGTVTSADGGVVPKASLSVDPGERDFDAPLERAVLDAFGLPGSAEHDVDQHTRTDEHGRYRLPVLAGPGSFQVRAWHDDFVGSVEGPFTAQRSGEEVLADIVLGRGGTIRGSVLADGTPLIGATVAWRDPTGESGGRDRIDPRGEYELRGVLPGEVRLAVQDSRGNHLGLEATLTVADGGTSVHDFEHDQELTTLSGRVILDTGEPLADVRVSATAGARSSPDGMVRALFGSESSRYASSGKTAADGSFSLAVAPERTYQVSAYRQGRVREQGQSQSVDNVPAGASDVELVLPSQGSVRLQLVDAASRQPLRTLGARRRQLAWRPSDDETFRATHAELDVDGVLELVLPLGVVDVSLAYSQDGYAPQIASGLVVKATENPEPIVVALTRGLTARLTVEGEQDRALLAGHLVFLLAESQLDQVRGPFPSQGAPANHRINGINLWLGQPALMSQMLSLQRADEAVIPGLLPGRYHIRCLADDLVFEPASFELTAESTTHAITWGAK